MLRRHDGPNVMKRIESDGSLGLFSFAFDDFVFVLAAAADPLTTAVAVQSIANPARAASPCWVADASLLVTVDISLNRIIIKKSNAWRFYFY